MNPLPEKLLSQTPVIVNVGVRTFCDDLAHAGYEVLQVDWSPPAGGDTEIEALLDDLL